MSFGFGLGFPRARSASLEAAIAALFPDVWYDPSDLTTLFTDSAGTTPVTAVEQPVGLMRDKSGRGNHAYHTPGDTTTRPVLSRRINLLTKTEDFADAAWAKVATASATSPTSLSFPAVNDYVYQGLPASSAAGRSFTVSMKLSGSGTVAIGFYDNVSAFQTTTVTLTATPITYTTTKTIGAGAVDVRVLVGRIGSVTATSVTATQASLVPADLAALPYQRVNTTTDYDSDASKFPTFLRCDGVNDSMQTNAIDFSGTDKMFVGAAVRKLSDAAINMIVELSAEMSTNNGAFFVLGGNASTGAAPAYSFASKGTTNRNANSPSTFAAPITNVLSGVGNISGDSSILRVNGAQAAQNAGDQGTGNYGNHKLYLFARGGTSLPFNGWFYGGLIKGATLSASQIALAERWLAEKTKTVMLA